MNIDGFRPAGDRTLVRRQEQPNAQGILLPEGVKGTKQQIGQVVSTGPGTLLQNGSLTPLPWNPGDTVLFAGTGPVEIRIGADHYLLLERAHVYGHFSPRTSVSFTRKAEGTCHSEPEITEGDQ